MVAQFYYILTLNNPIKGFTISMISVVPMIFITLRSNRSNIRISDIPIILYDQVFFIGLFSPHVLTIHLTMIPVIPTIFITL